MAIFHIFGIANTKAPDTQYVEGFVEISEKDIQNFDYIGMKKTIIENLSKDNKKDFTYLRIESMTRVSEGGK